MEPTKKKKSIRLAIENDKVDLALDYLDDFIGFVGQIHNELQILTGRIKRVKKAENQGIENRDDSNVEKNKITLGTLYCCHEIEKKIKAYFPEIKYTVTSESLDKQLELKLMNTYERVKSVYQGASATFFKYREIYTNRNVMIRVLKNTHFEEGSAEEHDNRLQNALSIKHRHIIKILGADLANYPKHLILEYIDGVSLDHLIGRMPFSQSRALSMIHQLCEAIYHLHINNIVHKKIKPDKVLIDNELKPVISPFDIVSSQKGLESGSNNTINSLLYGAPELLTGELNIANFKCDQFSLGILAYEILVGKYLFYDGSLDEAINVMKIFSNRNCFFEDTECREQLLNDPAIPTDLVPIIQRMLEEDPADRYDSLQQVLAAISTVKIPVNENAEIALASYERACIANADLTDEFYDHLFEKSATIKAYFKKDTEKRKSRRARMLLVAIELLINNEEEKSKLMAIKSMPMHQGLSRSLYKTFIETIVECISANDYLWKHYDQEGGDNPVAAAWKEVQKKSLATLK